MSGRAPSPSPAGAPSRHPRRVTDNRPTDPLAALRALNLPDPLGEAIETLIAFGTRLRAPAAGRAVARGLAGRLHGQLLRLPALFGGTVAGDPAFAMLLALAADEDQARPTAVSDLLRASGAPATTALRHIDRLAARGLIARTGCPKDRRRTWVTLTAAGRAGVDAAVAELVALGT